MSIKNVQTTGGMNALLDTSSGEFQVHQDATPFIEAAKRDRDLSQMKGRTIAERDLVEKAWNCEYDELTSLDMSVYIRRLRMKLKGHHPALELTRHRWGSGVGYKLVASED